MISRDRILSALYLEEPDRVPVFDFIIENLIEKLTGKNRWKISVNDLIKIYKNVGMDAFPIHFHSDFQILEEGPRHSVIRDEWGNTFQAYEDGRLFLVDTAIKDLNQIDDYIFPEPKATERVKDVPNLIKEAHPLAAWGNVGTFYDLFCVGLLGLSGFIRALYQRPSLIEKILSVGEKFITEIGCAFIEAGCDAILITDDLAYQNGPFIPPKLMRKFVFPHYHELNRVFHKRGVPIILHSCGDVNLLLEDIAEAGFDALHPLDVKCNIDLAEVKRQFGDRLCLIGNVCCQGGTAEDISRKAKKCITQAAPGGGYILCSSNGIDFGVPYENSMALLTAPKKYGQYPIEK